MYMYVCMYMYMYVCICMYVCMCVYMHKCEYGLSLLLRTYTPEFGRKIASMMDNLRADKLAFQHDEAQDALAIWSAWAWDDMWDHADVTAVVRYLYGSTALQVPLRWKPLLPTSL